MTRRIETNKMMAGALKWTAIAIWLDLSDRIISGPLDQLFSHWHQTLWLVGVTACAQRPAQSPPYRPNGRAVH